MLVGVYRIVERCDSGGLGIVRCESRKSSQPELQL